METPEPIDVASLRAIGSHITDAAADEIERLRREVATRNRKIKDLSEMLDEMAKKEVLLDQKLEEAMDNYESSRVLATNLLGEIIRLETDGAFKIAEIVSLNVALLAAWCGMPWVGLPGWIAAAVSEGIRLWEGRKRA